MNRTSHAYQPPARSHPAHDQAHTTLVFTRAASRAVDRAAIEEFAIPGMILMENAARGACECALRIISESNMHAQRGDAVSARIPHALIVCGSGNNGGDGYALARHLHNHRIGITIIAMGDPAPKSDAAITRTICERMQLTILPSSAVNQSLHADQFTLIVDAIFGTGLDREITGEAARIIQWINASSQPVLAIDIPSGLDGDTGQPVTPNSPCIKATHTATFVGLKPGFIDLAAQRWLGETVVCDIGAPRELLERFGTAVHFPRR